MKKIFAVILAILLSAGAAVVYLWWENNALEVDRFEIYSEKLPEEFDGFKIAHVSDLHDACIGEENAELIAAIENEKPDIIAITGDLMDWRRTDFDAALSFLKRVCNIAKVYYITGNHEAKLEARGVIDEFYAEAEAEGVVFLRDDACEITRGGASITAIGIDEASHLKAEENIQRLKSEGFNLVLVHHPEGFEDYAETGADLFLTGHAHGGQVRLPFIGGLFAPGQGLFPKYDGGLYTENGSQMVLSRGIGNSLFPFRVNNRPELCVEILKRGE